MVSEDDTVFIIQSGNIVRTDTGFDSESDVKDYIDDNLPPGDYEYGVFNSVGERIVEEEPPEKKTYNDDDEKERVKNIRHEAGENDKIDSVSFYDTDEQVVRCSIHQQNIRYKKGEVDFNLYIDTSLFDDPPVSTIDREVEEEIIDIFESVSCGVATYMGYESSYAKRGRRDPYVVIYGRVHRDDEELIRRIGEEDYVQTIIRSSENITPVPIYDIGEQEDYLPEDYILVLNIDTVTDSFDHIPDSQMNDVEEILDRIKDEYDGVEFDWIGRVPFRKDYSTIGVGLSVN